nr:calcium-activated chloride channel regulator 1-like [Rhipicephalus microplus]
MTLLAKQLHCCVPLICVNTLEIDKTDGGYKDLLISINQDVPYNETIVENIKSLLRSSSHFLHRATNGLVYFKHVIINFPNTWPERSRSPSLVFEFVREKRSYVFVHEWAHFRYGVFDEYGRRDDDKYPLTYCDGKEVSQFCDSSNGVRAHNPNAPNKQNAVCKKRSTWEVISENEDFKGLSKPDLSKNIEVSFEETQQREDLPQRVVLVLDVSISMDL